MLERRTVNQNKGHWVTLLLAQRSPLPGNSYFWRTAGGHRPQSPFGMFGLYSSVCVQKNRRGRRRVRGVASASGCLQHRIPTIPLPPLPCTPGGNPVVRPKPQLEYRGKIAEFVWNSYGTPMEPVWNSYGATPEQHRSNAIAPRSPQRGPTFRARTARATLNRGEAPA